MMEIFIPDILLDLMQKRSFYYPYRLIQKSLQKLDKRIYLSTNHGMKVLGRGLSLNDINRYVETVCSMGELDISFSDCVINLDFLIDTHSLTGQTILGGPHYHLVETMSNGESIYKTEYIRLFEQGLLDLRLGHYVGQSMIGVMEATFETRLKSIKKESEQLVYGLLMVLPENGKKQLIVVDGKHRLAMASYFNIRKALIQVCLLNKEFYKDPFYLPLLKMAYQDSLRYKKNIQQFEAVHEFS